MLLSFQNPLWWTILNRWGNVFPMKVRVPKGINCHSGLCNGGYREIRCFIARYGENTHALRVGYITLRPRCDKAAFERSQRDDINREIEIRWPVNIRVEARNVRRDPRRKRSSMLWWKMTSVRVGWEGLEWIVLFSAHLRFTVDDAHYGTDRIIEYFSLSWNMKLKIRYVGGEEKDS